MSREPSILFVMPEGSSRVSGGNLYNAGLLRALEQRAAVEVIAPAPWLSAPGGPGVVLVDSLNLQEFLRVAAKRVTGQYFVLLVHHLPSLEPGLDPQDATLELERQALPLFDGFVTTGSFACTWLQERLPGARIVNIEPPISPPVPAEAYQPGQLIKALMVGNLIERKGVLPLLEGLAAQLPDAEFQLDVVGRPDLDPVYAQRCQALLQHNPLLARRVRLRGSVAHEHVTSWYQQASLFVSASSMETFGISLQEARHHGLPIFALRGGHVASHLRAGHTGELFDARSDLVRAFVDLVEHPEKLRAYSLAALRERPLATQSWPEAVGLLLGEWERWFAHAE